jgi:hypothetical protein
VGDAPEVAARGTSGDGACGEDEQAASGTAAKTPAAMSQRFMPVLTTRRIPA